MAKQRQVEGETLPRDAGVSAKRSSLFLIGYRGTGKSTVARILAKWMGWRSVDSDDEVERLAGKSIAQVFNEDKETVFRDLEEKIVLQLCGLSETIVSLGGGAILRQATRDRLQNVGPVVGLIASVETIAKRLEADGTTYARRPSLTGQGVKEEIAEVLAVRRPFYRQCATLEIDTEGKTPEQIAGEILDQTGLNPCDAGG